MTQNKNDPIKQLLDGTYPDPEGLGNQSVATESLAIEKSLAGMERDLIQGISLGRRIAIVSDPQTRDVLGRRVERALEGPFTVHSIVFPDAPHPDDVTVAKLREATRQDDALIAIGSGTINDLCKYASAKDSKPYAVFATAPSMNGYTSVNAAITEHGHKKSLAAQAPRGAFFDLSVLSAAPVRLIRSGLGDSLCRATSQADWLLAHLLLGKPYRELPYALLAADESSLFENAADLVAGSNEVMESLVRTLVLSGFGTAIIGNSQPASQGEHLISHYIDMFEENDRPLVYHGEQIGVTTLSMARLQRDTLQNMPVLSPDTETLETFIARYGEELGRSCWDEFVQKRLDQQKRVQLNEQIAGRWDAIRELIEAVLLTPEYLEKVLRSAGARTTPEEIHLSRAFYAGAILHCRDIRNRFTFLDIAASTGKLTLLKSAI